MGKKMGFRPLDFQHIKKSFQYSPVKEVAVKI